MDESQVNARTRLSRLVNRFEELVAVASAQHECIEQMLAELDADEQRGYAVRCRRETR